MKSYSFVTFLLLTTMLNSILPCLAAQKSYDNEPQAKRQRREERNNQNRPPLNNPRDFFTAQTEYDIEQALTRGCKLGWKNRKGRNALHNAIIKNNLTVAKALMKCDQKDSILISQSDNNGFTPLHLAAKLGRLNFIKAMDQFYQEDLPFDFAIQEGKDTYRGYTPLYLACLYANSETVQYLLNQGCLPNIQEVLQEEDKHTDDYPGTALTLACSYDASHENTPAINTTIITIIDMLLEKDPTIINMPEEDNITPLHLTCENKNHVLAAHLLAKGANPNVCDHDQETPLHIACENNTTEIVQSLLAYHANPNVYDHDQDTPLHLACENSNPITIALLLNYGANVHMVNKLSTTPTQIIAQGNSDTDTKAPLLKLLYAYGAHTHMQEHNNDCIATCIRHINTNHAALTNFLHTLTQQQKDFIVAQLPAIVEFACAADQKAFSNKNLAALQKTFPRYTASYKPGYIHIAQLYGILLFKNKLHMMQQNKVKCNVMFEFLN